jgi:hypothetical protein
MTKKKEISMDNNFNDLFDLSFVEDDFLTKDETTL